MSNINLIDIVKNIFYFIGSSAGLFAALRPVFESKLQQDIQNARKIIERIGENRILYLDSSIYSHRCVSSEFFVDIDILSNDISEKKQCTRFSSHISCYFNTELKEIMNEYSHLRNYIQVPEWEPRYNDDNGKSAWYFNKYAESFYPPRKNFPESYLEHLKEAAEIADKIKTRFLRFQALTELHYIETIFHKWTVPKLYKKHNLTV
ncbi:TPA: hypothetical protein WHT72_001744 [Neisseria meningitidis]|nr:hypothetical protein [Neisseria meningitidis]MBR7236500.1 hypothetical protein [Neisseria meningitidis]MBW3879660.1 hypothetical protein [Neisseria meningitidis]MCG8961114.1 hypothetical protein [Neisseria meningitidis]RPC01552.1 hypothetical protein JY21_00950 [Neisseria meningitidis]